MTPALWIGAAIVLLGAVAAFMIPVRRRPAEAEVELEPAYAEAA
jgi:energy-converting hydrogenase Eha subunit E